MLPSQGARVAPSSEDSLSREVADVILVKQIGDHYGYSGLEDYSNFVADQRPKNYREGILLLNPNGSTRCSV